MNGRAWTDAEDEAVLAVGLIPHTERCRAYSRLRDLSKQIDRSYSAMMSRLRKLHRDRGHVAGNQWTTVGLWTAEEDSVILGELDRAINPRRVARGTWDAVASQIDRTPDAIKQRACQLRRR